MSAITSSNRISLVLRLMLLGCFAWIGGSGAGAKEAGVRPNIVVILSDDQGYADVSYNKHHPKEVRTPHTDALAKAGVICTQAYTTGHVCSPTRAGLMTGRYQQRFGIYTAGEGGSGVPLSETFIPQYLKPAGYVSGAFGKWHLGVELKYNAMHRGFDEFYGFMGRGAHDYFNLTDTEHPIYRGLKPIQDKGYLTDRITEEAVSFIKRNKSKPFFAYVAYNAVHAPPQAPEDEIKNLTGDKTRDTLMAMIKHLDDGVGQIVKTLKDEGLFDNTLLIYLTDNGGSKAMSANNAPLRGYKQQDYEGGVRVPFIVSWPDKLKGGAQCDVPIFSLDILPTVLAAAGVEIPEKAKLDGRDIMPALTGKVDKLRDHMFWSSAGVRGQWAVRSGQWKLVAIKGKIELFDLNADIGETKDLARKNPKKVAELSKLYDTWLDQMAEPISGQAKRWSKDAAAPTSKANKKKQRDLKKKKRQEEREKNKKDKTEPSKDQAQPKAAAPKQSVAPVATIALAATPDTAAAPPSKADKKKPKPYNVLLIVCDDLNTHVSTSGYPHIKTPGFDQLSSAGMTFSRAYCQYPVCGPSRASFLSGLYPESTGVVDNKADIRKTRPNTPTLPQFFKQGGYWTAGVGKVFHNPKANPGPKAWNTYQRFDNERNPVLYPIQKAFEAKNGSIDDAKNRKAWRAKLKEIKSKISGQSPPGYGPTDMTDAEHKDGKNVRQIARWIDEKANGDKPFFIVCGIQKPHVPFWAPKKYFDLYPLDELSFAAEPEDDWNDIPARAMVKRFQSFGFELGKNDPKLRSQYMQAYHACVSFIDAQIQLLFETLKRNGAWDNTIIVLTSDHGYHLGEHFMWGKVTLFEQCARVPLVVRVPGLTRPGAKTEALVELVDLFPTLADLAGIRGPAHLQGQSFVPILGDPQAKGKLMVYTVVSRGPKLGRSIRTARYRYAQWDTPDQNELYDLQKDPGEYTNLAKRADHLDRVKQMRKMLTRKQSDAARAKSGTGKTSK